MLLIRREALNEPLDGGAEHMSTGLVVELDGDRDQCAAFGGEVGIELGPRFRRHARGGGDRSVGRFSKFGFEPADHGNDTLAAAEMPEEKLTAGSLGEGEQRTGVNGAEMVEILVAGRKTEKLRRVGSGF